MQSTHNGAHPFPELKLSDFPPKRGDAAEMDKRKRTLSPLKRGSAAEIPEGAKNSSERT